MRLTPDTLADVQDAAPTLVGTLDGLEAALLLLRDPAARRRVRETVASLEDLLQLAGAHGSCASDLELPAARERR